jgi:hypothetical protein
VPEPGFVCRCTILQARVAPEENRGGFGLCGTFSRGGGGRAGSNGGNGGGSVGGDHGCVLSGAVRYRFVAVKSNSSQPMSIRRSRGPVPKKSEAEKSEAEISTRDAEYGFHTSHEMAIRRREILFVADGVTPLWCDESGERFYKNFPRLVKRELGRKMGSVEDVVKSRQRGTAEGTIGCTPSARKSVNAWI